MFKYVNITITSVKAVTKVLYSNHYSNLKYHNQFRSKRTFYVLYVTVNEVCGTLCACGCVRDLHAKPKVPLGPYLGYLFLVTRGKSITPRGGVTFLMAALGWRGEPS